MSNSASLKDRLTCFFFSRQRTDNRAFVESEYRFFFSFSFSFFFLLIYYNFFFCTYVSFIRLCLLIPARFSKSVFTYVVFIYLFIFVLFSNYHVQIDHYIIRHDRVITL